MSQIYEKYFDWNDFLNYADWQDSKTENVSHDTDDQTWFGTPNFGVAMHLARYGWTECLNKIKNIDIDCFDRLNQQQLWETKYSVVGSEVDIGRYVIGMPDCMSHRIPYYIDTVCACPKFVNIVVNTSFCCKRDFDYVVARGVQILSTINTLEINNVRTKLILLTNVVDSESLACNVHRIFIKIKDYQDIFYLEKLMFPIAHPSFFRRLVFSAMEREPQHIRKQFGFYWNCGYGMPTNKFEYNDPNILYFGTETLHNDQVTKWIQSVLHDNPKNYDGESILNHHLDELQYAAARKKMFER